MAVIARAHRVSAGSKLSGRQSFRRLWESSRALSAAVLAWAALDAVDGPLVAAYFWWLGLLLLVMWLVVRRVILRSVLRQAIDMRGQTTAAQSPPAQLPLAALS